MTINLNLLAAVIGKIEGKRKGTPHGQVKEIVSITLDELCKLPIEEVVKFLEKRYKKLIKKKGR